MGRSTLSANFPKVPGEKKRKNKQQKKVYGMSFPSIPKQVSAEALMLLNNRLDRLKGPVSSPKSLKERLGRLKYGSNLTNLDMNERQLDEYLEEFMEQYLNERFEMYFMKEAKKKGLL